jgi:hypothetical protein
MARKRKNEKKYAELCIQLQFWDSESEEMPNDVRQLIDILSSKYQLRTNISSMTSYQSSSHKRLERPLNWEGIGVSKGTFDAKKDDVVYLIGIHFRVDYDYVSKLEGNSFYLFSSPQEALGEMDKKENLYQIIPRKNETLKFFIHADNEQHALVKAWMPDDSYVTKM